MNHYEWLEINFPKILVSLGVEHPGMYSSLISAHGDKCYQYMARFGEEGIPFCHGVAMYLLTHIEPYSKYSRETAFGWIAPIDWICDNYRRLERHFPLPF